MKVAAFFCRRCGERLSHSQKMCSHGVCPYCGAVGRYGVVDCETRAVDEPEFSLHDIFLLFIVVGSAVAALLLVLA